MKTTPQTHPSTWLGTCFPHPLLSLLLGVSWLALAHSLILVHWLAALLLAWAVPQVLRPFLGRANRIHWPTALRLAGVVLWDIVVSNITVARLVLGSMSRLHPAWVPVPLASNNPMVNSLLATIITTTPGTVSAVVDENRGEILVHALDCRDPQAMAQDIKSRYEAPLLKVFGVCDARGTAS